MLCTTIPNFCSELSTTVDNVIAAYPGLMVESLIPHPLPPTSPSDPLSRETLLLILYIVVGALGALILFIILAAFVIFCYLRFNK